MTTTIDKPINEPTLELEYEVLKQFCGLTNPKKIVKLAKRLYGETTDELKRQLCSGIAQSKDPVAKIKRSFSLYTDSCILVEQCIQEGKHGLIIIGKDVYPFHLKTVERWLTEGIPWDKEEELNILYEAAEDWMRVYEKDKFLGKVVLFSRYGFSGVPRLLELTTEYDEGLTSAKARKVERVEYRHKKF